MSKPISEIDVPEDHGVTPESIARLAPIIGRIALNHSFIDVASAHVFAKLPEAIRSGLPPLRRVPFDDRLQAIRDGAAKAAELKKYEARLRKAVSLTRSHTAVRDIVCHWSLTEYQPGDKARARFVQTILAPDDDEHRYNERWLSVAELWRAVAAGLDAADLFYDVLFEDEGEVRPSKLANQIDSADQR